MPAAPSLAARFLLSGAFWQEWLQGSSIVQVVVRILRLGVRLVCGAAARRP